jgi:hypothetical protein
VRLLASALLATLAGTMSFAAARPLVVRSATLAVKTGPDGRAVGAYSADIEFTEADLVALCDDEANVELSVRDRDGHGGRRLLEDLEDCRTSADGSMTCPGGVVFHRLAGRSPRWRLTLPFHGRSPAGTFRGPVTVRFAYSVSGGPETVHAGTIASCKPPRGGPALTCAPRR